MKRAADSRSMRWLRGVLVLALALSALAPSSVNAQAPVLRNMGEEYLILRDAYIGRLRGLPYDQPDARVRAIEEMERQEAAQTATGLSSLTWASIGPAPIPNGQTSPSTAVSGRVSAIAIHPTDPNIVYVGAAQGGVYRSVDGGTTWTPIFDNAQSLAIGAIAIAPSDPTTIFVGTGEANFSCDSFFGVGVYRITNADTQPVLAGPFNRNGSSVDVMTGRSISQIVVHPTDTNTIFVSTTSGVSGTGCRPFSTLPNRGLFRSTNALSTPATFTKLTVASAGDDRNITDLAMEPGTPNNLLAVVRGANVAGDGGVYRTTNALAATPSFTQRLTFLTADARGLFAINKVGSVVTALVASGEGAGAVTCGTGGTLRRSIDGGQTWSTPIAAANGFCSGQCFYNIGVAIDPANASNILLGGQDAGTCSKLIAQSTTAGAAFTDVSAGVHVDTHVVVYAPSNPMIAYLGTDGGIYKSTDGGATWTSKNTTSFNATQFQSLALHPVDREFMIGGTQDNGTMLKRANGTWTRADFGDGGFALIDRNATDTTNVTMYHTYFNDTDNLIGFARVNTSACAVEGEWSFKGIYTGPVDPTVHCDGTTDTFNGISIADASLFYAPMALGPGTPNTVYFGTDKLYRSTNKGDTMTIVSQLFAAGVEVSAIGISPQNDNVRIVGLRNGKVFRTTTGAVTLTDVSGPIPAFSYIARAVIDPNNVDTAYVTLAEYGHLGQQIWKTTNLSNATPTWVASSAGIPDVPISAFVVDPANSSTLYAGTDIGVYRSTDGGTTWAPFGTGLPRVAVFDMAIQNTFRVLRIATHGRGIWEISIGAAILGLVDRDFDQSGKSDILWRNTTSGAVAMWLMDGATVLSNLGLGTADTSWVIAQVDDFNGDGKADLLWRNTTSGAAVMWLMSGGAIMSNLGLGTVSTSWVIEQVGDFNGDGKDDLLWRNSSSGVVAMWLMDGGAIVSNLGLGAVASDWTIAKVGDFDGDGKADILWRNTTSGAVTIWFMNGGTVTSSVGLGAVTLDWTIAKAADFNGDGKDDILWRNTTSGAVAMWLMNGATVASTAGLGAVTLDWTIDKTGDYNADAKADILWRNTTSGAVTIWFMNGGTVTSTAGLGTIPTIWQTQ